MTMSDGVDMDIDKSFEDLLERAFVSLKPSDYEGHPSLQMLLAYVYEQTDPLTAARISAHMATCRECSERAHALREERERADEALARYLREHSKAEAERLKLKGLFRRVLTGPTSRSAVATVRRRFYGHLAAWAAASGLVAFFLFRCLKQPVMVLEGSTTPTTGGPMFTFMLKLLYGLAGALGLWGVTGLALHGYRAFHGGRRARKGRETKGGGDVNGD